MIFNKYEIKQIREAFDNNDCPYEALGVEYLNSILNTNYGAYFNVDKNGMHVEAANGSKHVIRSLDSLIALYPELDNAIEELYDK